MSKMNPEEQMRWQMQRAMAALHRAHAARAEASTAAIAASASLRNLAEAVQSSVDGELAGHPDMAELNIQLDSFYGGSM